MTGLFYPLNKISIFLPILVFFLVLYDAKVTMIYALVFALFQASSLSTPLLLSIFILPLAALILIKIYDRFFTNKSIYSILSLNIIYTILYYVLSTLLFLIYHFYHYKTISSAINYGSLFNIFVWQIILTSIFVLIAFFVVNFLSNRLKTVFIDTSFGRSNLN